MESGHEFGKKEPSKCLVGQVAHCKEDLGILQLDGTIHTSSHVTMKVPFIMGAIKIITH